MSSFLGHSLTAWTIAPLPNSRSRWLWLGWLTVVALAPDCDYVIPWFHPSANEGLRITHALLSCQILPVLTILWLWWRGVRA
ncbi:MAG: hypothetical protein F6J87_20755 [Spirulina sp. SIO3F2]|nr:hypothetical protein [Spirulina sp. SIO3F2]